VPQLGVSLLRERLDVIIDQAVYEARIAEHRLGRRPVGLLIQADVHGAHDRHDQEGRIHEHPNLGDVRLVHGAESLASRRQQRNDVIQILLRLVGIPPHHFSLAAHLLFLGGHDLGYLLSFFLGRKQTLVME